MKLYYDPVSTSCRPILMFAAEHDLKLDLELVELASGQTHEPAFRAVNPNGLLPYFVDGDLAIGEGSAILKYLAEKVASPSYPTEIRARARVNAAMDWFNTQFHREFCFLAVYLQVLPAVLFGAAAEARPAFVRHSLDRSAHWLGVLDRHMIGARPFVCGTEITLADYLGAAYVTLGELVDFDFAPYANVRRWLATMKARLAWGEANAAFNGWCAALRAQAA
jgi:glutathione S-transferase